MKKTFIAKKIITFLTAAAILTGMLPVAIPVSAEAEDGMYIIYEENFENYTGESDVFAYTFTPEPNAAAAGRTGTATVEEETSGDKALKVVSKMTTAEASTGAKRDKLDFIISNLPDETGVIGFSFDVRMEDGYGRPFYRFGQLNDSDNAGAVMYAVGTYAHAMKDQDDTVKYVYFNDNAEFRFDYNLDLTNDKCTITVSNTDGTNAKTVTRNLGNYISSDGTVKLHFGQYVNSSWAVADTGIVWYDNIKVYAYQAQVSSTNPVNEAENVAAGESATITYSAPIDNLDSQKISVLANGEALSTFDATLSDDGKILSITPTGGLQYDTKYEIVLNDGFAEASDTKHQPPQTYTFNFKTKSIINPIDNWKESARFGEGFVPALTAPTGVNYTVTLAKDGASPQNYTMGTPINQTGSYVMSVLATDTSNSKTQSKNYEFAIVEPAAPVANNVHIECDTLVATGSVLKGCYEYESYNDIAEGITLFRWFKGVSENGPWSEITNATAQNYTLKPEDDNAWFKFEVKPYAQEEPREGEAVLSAPFMGAMRPVASDVSVSQEDNVLTGDYFFADSNGDDEDQDKTEFRWYKKNRISGEISTISDATSKVYELKETDIDDYIFFGVKPVSTVKPYAGEEIKSDPILLPCRPEVSNASISGKVTVGNIISAYYTFYDINGDKESGSVCTWYVDGRPKHEGATLELRESMAGKEIYFEITPFADAFPQEGTPVRSDTVKVANKKKSSGGSGTSSMKAGIVVNDEPKEDTLPDTNGESAENNQNIESNGFADTANHWAKKEIEFMKKKGIINGISATEFAPDKFVTRAEAAKLLAKAFNLSVSESSDFADVKAEDWFTDFVVAVSEAGFMRGDSGNFYPNRSMVREEICVILANIAQKYGLQSETTAEEFVDSDEISDWASESVKTVVSLGLMNGVGDGKFAPRQETTRAEIAVILYRVLEKLGL